MHRGRKLTLPWLAGRVMWGPEGFRITVTFDEAWSGGLVSGIHETTLAKQNSSNYMNCRVL